MPEELSRNCFDVILQHDWSIEQCLFHIRVFFGGKTKSPCFVLSIHWLIKQITNTYGNHFSRSYESRSNSTLSVSEMDECDKIGKSCPSNLKCLKKDGSFACGCENTGFIVKGSGENRTCQGTKSLLCENPYKKLPRGEKGCRTGESARLLPVWPVFKSGRRRHILIEFAVGSLLCTERFFSRYSSFLLSSKTNTS